MKSAFANLQRAIRKHQSAGPLRYPRELQAEIVAAVESRRADGHSWDVLTAELAIPYQTLRRWTAKANPKPRVDGPVAMRPVEVVERGSGSLVLVAPSGIRVEGASVEEIVALIRALG
jgi:hypothetical protein